MLLATTSTAAAAAAPITPAAAFVSQLRGATNPRGGDVETNADCGIASSLMAMWVTGSSPRVTGAAAVDDAFVAARQLATGRDQVDRGEPLFPADIDRLFTKAGVPHTMVKDGTHLLADVRRGATAVALGSGNGATPSGTTPNATGVGTWYERSSELGLPAVPGGHAVTITDYRASDDSFTVMDPLAQAPFRAPSREVATFLDQLKPWRYAAGVTVQPSSARG